LRRRARRSGIEAIVPDDTVAIGLHTGHQRDVAGKGDARHGRAHPLRVAAFGHEAPQVRHLDAVLFGLPDVVGAQRVDADQQQRAGLDRVCGQQQQRSRDVR